MHGCSLLFGNNFKPFGHGRRSLDHNKMHKACCITFFPLCRVIQLWLCISGYARTVLQISQYIPAVYHVDSTRPRLLSSPVSSCLVETNSRQRSNPWLDCNGVSIDYSVHYKACQVSPRIFFVIFRLQLINLKKPLQPKQEVTN